MQVDLFGGIFVKEKPYTIANGLGKDVLPKYPNVNNKIELGITRFAIVKECDTNILSEVFLINQFMYILKHSD